LIWSRNGPIPLKKLTKFNQDEKDALNNHIAIEEIKFIIEKLKKISQE
jgi:hypothetical protein